MAKPMMDYPYYWYWRKLLPERHGQPCRVVHRLKMNSIILEFEDGFRVVTSGFAIRKRAIPACENDNKEE